MFGASWECFPGPAVAVDRPDWFILSLYQDQKNELGLCSHEQGLILHSWNRSISSSLSSSSFSGRRRKTLPLVSPEAGAMSSPYAIMFARRSLSFSYTPSVSDISTVKSANYKVINMINYWQYIHAHCLRLKKWWQSCKKNNLILNVRRCNIFINA